jgi:hypothetical protein
MVIGLATPTTEQNDAGCRIYKQYEFFRQEETVKKHGYALSVYVPEKQSLPDPIILSSLRT